MHKSSLKNKSNIPSQPQFIIKTIKFLEKNSEKKICCLVAIHTKS